MFRIIPVKLNTQSSHYTSIILTTVEIRCKKQYPKGLQQSTVETSAFSSEMIAMKSCMEAIQGLRYKLKMFGVPLHGAAEVFCDNNSLVLNTSNVESKLNKKHNWLLP